MLTVGLSFLLFFLISNNASALDVQFNQSRQFSNTRFSGSIGELILKTNENITNVQITTDMTLNTTFSDNNFNMNTNDTKRINFTLNVPEYYRPYAFNSNFFVTYKNFTVVPYSFYSNETNSTINGVVQVATFNNIVVPFNFTVKEERTINTTSNLSTTVNNGETKSLFLNFVNTGNTPIFVNLTSTRFLTNISTTALLWPSENRDISFYVIAPMNTTPGNYTENITVVFGDERFVPLNVTFEDDVYTLGIVIQRQRTIPVNILIKDPYKPNLSITNKDSIELFQDMQIDVAISDNINVSNFTVIVLDPNGNITSFQDHKRVDYSTKMMGLHEIDLIAFDYSGNRNEIRSNFTVKPRKLITLTDDMLALGKHKIGNYSQYQLLQIYSATPVKISLGNYTITGEDSSGRIFINGNNFDEKIEINDNASASFNKMGYIYLGFSKLAPGRISGTLVIQSTDNTVDFGTKQVDFSIEFVNYELPQVYQGKLLGLYPRICVANDTGEYETSTYICTETYPIDINPDDMQTLVSQKALNEYDAKHGLEIADKTDEIVRMYQVAILLVLGLIFMIGFIIYQLYIWPKAFFLFK